MMSTLLSDPSPSAPAADTGEPLLSPAMLGHLERLELVSRKVFRGRQKGERISRRKGQSVEFADFRVYVAGDDLRLIDWNLYARFDQLFLKLFQEEEDLHFHALIDCSGSMSFGTPSKLRVAKQIAAALGYVGLCHGDRVSIQSLGPSGRGAPVVRSRAAFWKLTRYLDALPCNENIPMHQGVRDAVLRGMTPGVVVLITDLMDKTGYESALRMLVGRQMDVFVLQVLSPEELSPPIIGDRRLIDIEDGDAAEITVNAFVLAKYQETLRAFLAGVRQYCDKRSITHVMVPTTTPLETVITQYLRSRGVLR